MGSRCLLGAHCKRHEPARLCPWQAIPRAGPAPTPALPARPPPCPRLAIFGGASLHAPRHCHKETVSEGWIPCRAAVCPEVPAVGQVLPSSPPSRDRGKAGDKPSRGQLPCHRAMPAGASRPSPHSPGQSGDVSSASPCPTPVATVGISHTRTSLGETPQCPPLGPFHSSLLLVQHRHLTLPSSLWSRAWDGSPEQPVLGSASWPGPLEMLRVAEAQGVPMLEAGATRGLEPPRVPAALDLGTQPGLGQGALGCPRAQRPPEASLGLTPAPLGGRPCDVAGR